MEYRAGSRMRVKNNLEVDYLYDGCFFTASMSQYRGKIVTIDDQLAGTSKYHVKETGNRLLWSGEMFEGLAEFTKDDLRPGMVLEIRDGDRYLFIAGERLLAIRDSDVCTLRNHNNDLKCFVNSECDVMTVYEADTRRLKGLDNTGNLRLIWERLEPRKISKDEAAKILGKKFGEPVEIVGA